MSQEITLEYRRRMFFYQLSCEDPKHPKINFILLLMGQARKKISEEAPNLVPDEQVITLLTSVVDGFLDGMSEEAWKIMIGNYHPEELYGIISARMG